MINIKFRSGADIQAILDAILLPRYLDRNPNLNCVANVGENVVGCIMSGHDGRRGYLQHLVVYPGRRRKGIANALVENYFSSLEKIGICKFHIDVLKSNEIVVKMFNYMRVLFGHFRFTP